jgi:hypothetical protein
MFLRKAGLWVIGGGLLFSTIGLVSLQSRNVSTHTVAVTEPTTGQKDQVVDDPCWFQKGEEVIKNSSTLSEKARLRTEREINGYPARMSLKDAVALFNSEERCVPFRGTLPPLTEEEVVAAIVAGPTYGSEPTWRMQKDLLWAIAVRQELPAGSLLVAESGACAYNTELGKDVCVEGQRIYLMLGLDKNPRAGSPLKPEQVFLLRANYQRLKKLD